MNIQYKEEVLASAMVTVIMVLTLLIVLFLAIFQFTGYVDQESWGVRIFVFVLLAIVAGLVISFRKLTITVTDQQLIFGFGKFRKKLGLANLEKVEIQDYKFSNYLGYGIRFGRDGTVGYVPRGGKGLKITFKGERKPFFVISNTPENLKAILDKYIK